MSGLRVVQEGGWQVGATATISAAYVRPNDSTQYTAGDVIAQSTTVARMLTFQNIARSPGGGGIIQSATFINSVAAATKPDLELYIFDTQVVMQGDNAAWAPADLEMTYCVGVIAFPTGSFKTAGANGIIATAGLGQGFTCRSDLTDLYGILVVRNAYTPSALEQFLFRLQVLQD